MDERTIYFLDNIIESLRTNMGTIEDFQNDEQTIIDNTQIDYTGMDNTIRVAALRKHYLKKGYEFLEKAVMELDKAVNT